MFRNIMRTLGAARHGNRLDRFGHADRSYDPAVGAAWHPPLGGALQQPGPPMTAARRWR